MNTFKHTHGYPVQRCYAVLTDSPDYLRVMRWVEGQELAIEVHLNRTRFWLPEGLLLTEFLLRYSDAVMSCVEHDLIC